MKMQKHFFILLIMLLVMLFLAGGCDVPQQSKKDSGRTTRKVYTSYELGINYVNHVYTLGSIGFEDTGYSKKYKHTISREDLELLTAHADSMSFRHNAGGIFKLQLYFLPALNNFETEKAWAEYFTAWEKAIKEKSFEYIERYCTGFLHDSIEESFWNTDDEMWKQGVISQLPMFMELGDVFIRNFETYKLEIWPEIEPALRERSEFLNRQLEDTAYIDKWEEVTGYDFGENDYCIVLFYAGERGPSFNNLSLYKNTAYYNKDTNFMLDMFSHELGVHLIKPHVDGLKRELLQSGVGAEVIYRGNETLASFFNEKVLGRPEKNDFDQEFMRIYISLYQEGVTNPGELFEKGIKEYIEND